MFTSNNNELARNLKHDGVRVGEIIAYRAWRVIVLPWFESNDDRLHSVAMRITSGIPTSQLPVMCEHMGFTRSAT